MNIKDECLAILYGYRLLALTKEMAKILKKGMEPGGEIFNEIKTKSKD